MNEETTAAQLYQQWLSDKPQHLQEFAKTCPMYPGAKIIIQERLYWLVGFSENPTTLAVGLLISPINPHIDYEGAKAASISIAQSDIAELQFRSIISGEPQ